MAIDRFGTADAAACFSPEIAGTGYRRAIGYWTASIFALAAYAGLLIWILSSSTAKVYGFPVSHDLPTLIEITLQIGPMLAAFFMVMLLPVKHHIIGSMADGERPGRRVVITLAVSAAAALITVCVTMVAVLTVCEFRPGMLSATTALWVAGELVFDLTLIGVFTTALYALKRRLWVTMLLFILYVAVVITVGPEWGITSYIGFGSTVPVMVTTYSTAPLYDAAAWLLRGYWTCITLLMLSLLYAFDRPVRLRPRWALRVSMALAVACIAAGGGLAKLQAYGVARYQAPSTAALEGALQGDRAAARLHLTNFSIHVNYAQGKGDVGVEGVLSFHNGNQPARIAYFQMPGLMVPDQLQIQGGGDYRVLPLGKYVQVKFSSDLSPLQELYVQYRGTIRPAGAFDLAVQSKVLGNAFFLTDADMLLAARSPACLASPEGECANAENYLMSDRATGRITVVAPDRLSVISAGDESRRQLGDGTSEHVFTMATPRMATFLVACAPFRESVAVSIATGLKIRVLRSSRTMPYGASEVSMAERIVSFYETAWPAYPQRELKIIETPTPLGEAMAFDGEVALSDKIIASRSPISGTASNLLEFVMAHEIAHQWWGFRVAPARAPGRLFVLESIAQFAAYKYLSHRGILSEQSARQNEERRYRGARTRLGNREVPLVRSEIADEVAYNKGPFALLSIDQLDNGRMMNRLGGFLTGYAYEAHGAASPEQLAAALIAELRQGNREAARSLLYGAGDAARQ